MSRGLLIFAREPVPGRVKTRLARIIGDEGAAELYRAMLDDVIGMACGLEGIRPLLFWAADQGRLPAYSTAERCESYLQQGANLGERMAQAFSVAFAAGIRSCCIIGTDAPDLPPAFIRQAFDLLEHDGADTVFGPAHDGGYYLLGLRELYRGLFNDIAWSTPTVLSASLDRAKALGLRTRLLPLWYDIDTFDDLERLTTAPDAPRLATRAVLERLLNGLNMPVAPREHTNFRTSEV